MNKIYYWTANIVEVFDLNTDVYPFKIECRIAITEDGDVLDKYEKKNMVEKGATIIPLRFF